MLSFGLGRSGIVCAFEQDRAFEEDCQGFGSGASETK